MQEAEILEKLQAKIAQETEKSKKYKAQYAKAYDTVERFKEREMDF